MTPLRAVLCVVKVLPQVHVTVVSTYCGWMSGFIRSSPTEGRRVVRAGLRTGAVASQVCQNAPGRLLNTGRAWRVPGRRPSVPRSERGLLDLHQKLGVRPGLLHLVQQQLQRLAGLQGVQYPAQLEDDAELVGRHQDLLLAGAGGVDVDRREDPLVGELPVQLELHVASALELLEDHRVHRGAGLDQGGGQDRQRSAELDVAGGAEETLRRVQGGRVHATGQDASARRGSKVVGATQPGDGVEEHHHVVTELDQPLGSLDRELRDGGVVRRWAVEGGGDDLALHRPLHVGDLFWPLVDQDHHQVALRVVGRDCVGDRLENHRLASLRRADDQTALALADRGDQVDHPGGQHVRLGLQPQSVLRVERGQRGELRPLSTRLQVSAVDLVQAHQRVVLVVPLAVAGLADRPGHRVTTTQSVLAHLGERDVHVVRPGQVARGPHEGVVVEDVEDSGDRHQYVVLADHRLAVGDEAVLAVATAVATALPEPAAAAAAAASVVIVPEPVTLLALALTHLRAHETPEHLVCRLLLEKKKKKTKKLPTPNQPNKKNKQKQTNNKTTNT